MDSNINITDKIDIEKVEYFDHLSSMPFVGSIFFTIPLFVVFSVFITTSLSLQLSILLPLLFSTIWYGPKLHKIYQDNKKIEQINNQVVFEAPHKVIEGFFDWKKGDKIKLYYKDENKSQTFYYQGVLDNGLIICSEVSKVKRCNPEDVGLAPPEIFDIYEIKNLDLNKRIEEKTLEKIKEGMNSDYQEMVDEAKRELNELEQTRLE